MTLKKLVCTQCGYVGSPESLKKGSTGVEILLWIFFLIPGLIYTVWRFSSKHPICFVCKNPNLIPIDSPRAKNIIGETMSEEEIKKTIESEHKDVLRQAKVDKWIIIVIVVFFTLVVIVGANGN